MSKKRKPTELEKDFYHASLNLLDQLDSRDENSLHEQIILESVVGDYESQYINDKEYMKEKYGIAA